MKTERVKTKETGTNSNYTSLINIHLDTPLWNDSIRNFGKTQKFPNKKTWRYKNGDFSQTKREYYPTLNNLSDTRNREQFNGSMVNRESFLDKFENENIILPSFARKACSPSIPKVGYQNVSFECILQNNI